MELKIKEMGDLEIENLDKVNSTFEKNIKSVHFQDASNTKYFSHLEKSNIKNIKPQVTYEDILNKIGVFVSNGQLHLIDKPINSQNFQKYKSKPIDTPRYEDEDIDIYIKHSDNNNKYFTKEVNVPVRKSLTIKDYYNRAMYKYIQTQRVKQIKSKKLIIYSPENSLSYNKPNINKLFNFSKR